MAAAPISDAGVIGYFFMGSPLFFFMALSLQKQIAIFERVSAGALTLVCIFIKAKSRAVADTG